MAKYKIKLLPKEGQQNSFIYFVYAPEVNRVKIGHTTNIKNRMPQIVTSSPVRIKLIGVLPGNKEDELKLHNEFHCYRFQGEWFNVEYRLLAYLRKFCDFSSDYLK